MGAGYRGTFVISWSQTWIDGQNNPPAEALVPGADWAWQGAALRVDGPASVLRLDQAARQGIPAGARRSLRRIAGAMTRDTDPRRDEGDGAGDAGLVVSDGRRLFTVDCITNAGRCPLLVFHDEMPPRGRRLRVLHTGARQRSAPPSAPPSGFLPGTMIATPNGPRPVESLTAGALVSTRDAGPQTVVQADTRHLTGADLFARPALRPVRIETGSLGIRRPDAPLLVAPGHRLLLRGRASHALFNCAEVLISAADLLGHPGFAADLSQTNVTYHTVLLSHHAVLFANGVEAESRLDAGSAATPARRCLSRAEAAILLHRAA